MDDATPPPRLRVRGLRKAFAAPVLRGISLDVRAGEVHALIGANGAGKSTLSKIVAGLLRPDAGAMERDGRPFAPASRRAAGDAGVQIVHQELNLLPTLSVGENLLLGRWPARAGLIIDRRRLREEATRALAALGLEGLDPDAPLAEVGIGHQQLVEIAAALSRPCRVLLLDEPTAALTDPQVERLFARLRDLKAAGAGMVYVSHRLEELRRIADRVSVLRDGEIVATVPADALSVPEAVRLMVGRAVAMRGPGRAATGGRVAMRVEGLSRGPAVKGVSLAVREGEILGLAGLVGAGRTELLRAIVGADRPDSGAISLGDPPVPRRVRRPADAARAGVGMVPEDRKRRGLLLPLAVRANASLGRLRALGRGPLRLVDRRAERAEVESAAGRTQLRCRSIEQPASELSGGNQQKVLLGRWLLRGPRVLLLDEPTRGVDLEAREAIHRLLVELADAGTAIVLVSSEFEELLSLCDRIAVLSAGRLVETVDRDAPGWTTEALLHAAFREHLATREVPQR
jgi:ribose transport system ATP-binding protein